MIRPALPSDSKKVATLIVQAMGDLAMKFCNSDQLEPVIPLFEHFFQLTDNQYSFENTLVYENEEGVVGNIGAYDGAKLETYRKPFFDHLAEHFGLVNFNPEPETESGEFYLDTISVDPAAQGKGIGKLLIVAGIDWAKKLGHKKVGLLVDVNNDRALKLYQNMGFEIVEEKPFMGGLYHHMVYRII
ncbi:GNAT family N-acetyltransferase [Albibacterium bauzanense]|uniref:Acetyltransferase (GNAT) family protein n=1 Tax=Albibacterium bauzanense TaxID=653929 RepID=A0A4R1LUK9_9SPHI|nr:GNAT family N-acetyltransferase [Albibacterium bauzanense]TCK80959.1 acetyltransferase (GNAT) family protein [Albibacterium bauzanense]